MEIEDKKKRKYEEDNILPKYIIANRKQNQDKIIAYSVYKFPIGILKKEYITKRFSIYKKRNKKETLDIAIKYLEELKEKYKDLHIKISEKNKMHNQNKLMARNSKS